MAKLEILDVTEALELLVIHDRVDRQIEFQTPSGDVFVVRYKKIPKGESSDASNGSTAQSEGVPEGSQRTTEKGRDAGGPEA